MGGAEKLEENQLLEVYVSCRDALVRSVLKMRARQEDVDDILQETYLRTLHANDKKPITSLKGYLFRVSRNLVLEKLSHRSREITMEINDALPRVNEISVDRALHYKQKLEMFNDALRSLPEQKRSAILLRKFYGLSYREIARKMNVSIGSVEKYVSSGIKQCKRNLSSMGYEFEQHPGIRHKNPHQETGSGVGKE
ncbi:MAG TPA: sigma-70 family RNA polymerase sigma factor [Pseudomonadales bacterium]|jgi:RNA polymerase sigma-70 factor (ECF subfamily)|nr:sigma-70 family RNA polymerase sigma factor [Pseudomonadales bacterium]MDP7313712.1 sigma-70 family RNA polymerase sigma factor [Pseudomonadales bacterium]HJP49813.1 sigma-70 family RNA polymerase sigma factor [Pseudomonadales bacterium]|tara:strand:- start:9354 stop:9941 length:588 start_codon:yes stop_codon:yes gene_type:complete